MVKGTYRLVVGITKETGPLLRAKNRKKPPKPYIAAPIIPCFPSLVFKHRQSFIPNCLFIINQGRLMRSIHRALVIEKLTRFSRVSENLVAVLAIPKARAVANPHKNPLKLPPFLSFFSVTPRKNKEATIIKVAIICIKVIVSPRNIIARPVLSKGDVELTAETMLILLFLIARMKTMKAKGGRAGVKMRKFLGGTSGEEVITAYNNQRRRKLAPFRA